MSMSGAVLFILGVFIGGVLGIVIMACASVQNVCCDPDSCYYRQFYEEVRKDGEDADRA